MAITLTLKLGSTEVNFPAQSTDVSGYFTVDVSTLPAGTYQWRVKAPKYLAKSGTVVLTGAAPTSEEMGLIETGDANDDNVVTILDFGIVRSSYGRSSGSTGYDDRADFTGDGLVNVLDFNLMKNNFSMIGAPPLMPGK